MEDAPHPTYRGMEYLPTPTDRKPMRIGGYNDFHAKILNLGTLHKNFMYTERRYQISLYRSIPFGGHHCIVVSDGVNEDITLELTVAGDKRAILSGQQETIPAVNIFNGDRRSLERKGTVECTLHKLTEIAANIIRRNPHYNFFSNNCQDFCNMFLDELSQETYMTDPQRAKMAGKIASSVVGSTIVVHSAGTL